jgi:hypothetical protein
LQSTQKTTSTSRNLHCSQHKDSKLTASSSEAGQTRLDLHRCLPPPSHLLFAIFCSTFWTWQPDLQVFFPEKEHNLSKNTNKNQIYIRTLQRELLDGANSMINFFMKNKLI